MSASKLDSMAAEITQASSDRISVLQSKMMKGISSDRISVLQSKIMKGDTEGYETEISLVYSQFKSSVELFQLQFALNYSSIGCIGGVAKAFGNLAMFLAHATPSYPGLLAEFPRELANFLLAEARNLPSFLRLQMTQALIFLINRQIVDIGEILGLFMELQTLEDKNLRKLAFSQVVCTIRRMNLKHKNEAKTDHLKTFFFSMLLQEEDEAKAKRSLVTLCFLYRQKVWFDDRTAEAIYSASSHASPKIRATALSFQLNSKNIEEDDDGDD